MWCRWRGRPILLVKLLAPDLTRSQACGRKKAPVQWTGANRGEWGI